MMEKEIRFDDMKKVEFNGKVIELHRIHAEKLIKKGKATEVKGK